jgi:hypothetical protein
MTMESQRPITHAKGRNPSGRRGRTSLPGGKRIYVNALFAVVYSRTPAAETGAVAALWHP